MQELRQIIASVADIPEDQVTPDADLTSLGIDSLMALSIISKAEKRYRIQIPEQELRGVRTMRQIAALFGHNGVQITI